MRSGRAPLVTCLVAAVACAQPPTPARFGLAWAGTDSTPACAVLPDSTTQVGDSVTLIAPAAGGDGDDAIVRRAQLVGKADVCAWFAGPVAGGFALSPVDLGGQVAWFAILGPVAAPVARDGYLAITVPGAHEAHSLKVCTSMEGLHFTVWEGRPLESRRLYHAYAPLGYDVEPSCSDAETGDDGAAAARHR